jgi:hypothetical protein
MRDNFQDEISNETDPEVDDAIVKHRAEAPDAYETTGTLSRPSRSSRPQLTEGVLRDMRRHGGGGAGYTSGGTPINPEQLRGEAQTRAFFRKAGQNKTQGQAQLDPYAYADAAAQLKEFYNPTQGALKGQHFDPPTEFVDTTLAASNEAWNAAPHRKATMSERSIHHINPYDPDPFTKKPKGDTSTSELDRQEKSLAWLADPKNNKGRTEFQQYESSPAEVNPQVAYSQKLANQKAYASAMVIKRRKEAEKNPLNKKISSTDISANAPYLDPKENRANNGEGVKKSPSVVNLAPLSAAPNTNPPIKTEDRKTWKTDAGESADMSNEEERNKKLSKPSRYFSAVDGEYVITNEYDQPQHTNQLADIAYRNLNKKDADLYVADLRNSINAEMLSGGGARGSIFHWGKVNFDKTPTKDESAAINQMADDLLQQKYWREILEQKKSKSVNRTDEQVINHIDNLEKRYETKMKEAKNMWLYSAST